VQKHGILIIDVVKIFIEGSVPLDFYSFVATKTHQASSNIVLAL